MGGRNKLFNLQWSRTGARGRDAELPSGVWHAMARLARPSPCAPLNRVGYGKPIRIHGIAASRPSRLWWRSTIYPGGQSAR